MASSMVTSFRCLLAVERMEQLRVQPPVQVWRWTCRPIDLAMETRARSVAPSSRVAAWRTSFAVRVRSFSMARQRAALMMPLRTRSEASSTSPAR